MKKTLTIYLAVLQLATTVYSGEPNTKTPTVKRRNSSLFNNSKPPMSNFLKRATSENGLKERAQSLPVQEKALNIITNAETIFEKEQTLNQLKKNLLNIAPLWNAIEQDLAKLDFKKEPFSAEDLTKIEHLKKEYLFISEKLDSIQQELKKLNSKKCKKNSFISFQKKEL